jgi:hypothetical protein
MRGIRHVSGLVPLMIMGLAASHDHGTGALVIMELALTILERGRQPATLGPARSMSKRTRTRCSRTIAAR